MTKYKFGDIVLIIFTQTDGSLKKRPAMVVLDIGDDDIVLAPITTTHRRGKGDYKIRDWQIGGLLSQSWLRLAKITCLEKVDVEYSIGHIFNFDKTKVVTIWKRLFE